MTLTPGSEVVLVPEKPAAGGRMLARHEGQVVFVSGAVPGERVRARVERVSKQLAFADTIEVLEPSADRRAPFVDQACGGSVYAHIQYERQLSLKRELVLDAFTRVAKLPWHQPVSIAGSREDGYRMRARLHVRGDRIGFFREGTHDLCDAGPTQQLLPETLPAVGDLLARMAADLRPRVISCEIAENVAGDERAVLVDTDDGASHVLAGPAVHERIEVDGTAIALTHDVRSFFQGNRWLLGTLIQRVLAQIPDGSVLDLYAGVGLFAVSLAAQGRSQVTAVEGDRASASDLAENARPYPGLDVRHESVEAFVRQGARADTLIVDPPRTGISNEAMAGAIRLRSPRIVYVSCDLATLARDVRRLVDAGYTLQHLEAFDLFPNTAHVETLAVLQHGGHRGTGKSF